MEPPLLSPGADSSALDEPKVDHLVKLEESEDVEGEPNRLVKCSKLRIFIDTKTGNFSCISFSFSDHVLSILQTDYSISKYQVLPDKKIFVIT